MPSRYWLVMSFALVGHAVAAAENPRTVAAQMLKDDVLSYRNEAFPRVALWELDKAGCILSNSWGSGQDGIVRTRIGLALLDTSRTSVEPVSHRVSWHACADCYTVRLYARDGQPAILTARTRYDEEAVDWKSAKHHSSLGKDCTSYDLWRGEPNCLLFEYKNDAERLAKALTSLSKRCRQSNSVSKGKR